MFGMWKTAALLVLAAWGAADGCATDADCNLNGVCTQTVPPEGADVSAAPPPANCACDAWWTGPQCSQLKLGAAKPDGGYRTTSGAKFSSWGASAVLDDDGTYHLFAAEWTRDCGILYWSPNSRVVRATSRAVDGPYVFQEEILPTFYTNPQLTTAADGTLLLFVIGMPCNHTADCTNSSAPPGPAYKYSCVPHTDMQDGISMLSSSDGPLGPWTNHGRVLSGSNPRGGMFTDVRTNPAPLAEKDGTVKLIYRGGSKGYKAEFIGVAAATTWRGPYTPVTNPAVPAVTGNAEDPFVYRDCRGGYHMLAHAIGPGVHGGVGLHAFSHDGISWHDASPSIAYTDVVAWSNGTNTTLAQRERPVLVFGTGKDGCHWVPIALINGARMAPPTPIPPTSAAGEFEREVKLGAFPNAPTFTLIVPVVGGDAA